MSTPFKMKGSPFQRNFVDGMAKDKKETKITRTEMSSDELKKNKITPKEGVTYYMNSNGKMSTATNVKN